MQGVTTRTEYGYDVQGRLTSVLVVDRLGTNPNELTEYIFNRFGQLDWEVGPNGVTKDNQYDDHGRLDRIVQFNDTNTNGQLDAGETMVAQFDYTHDAVGNRLSSTEQIGGLQQTFTYVYDDLNRLTQETLTSTTDSSRDYTTTYAFDLSSNRVGMSKDAGNDGTTNETTAYTHDRNDRLLTETSSTDGTTNYGYGPGNAWTTQTTKTQPNGTTITQTYDVMGRLKTVSIDASASGGAVTTEEYTYSTSGIRTSRTVDGVKTVFLYDLQNPTGYAQILEQGIDANGDNKLQFVEVDTTFTNGLDVITQATIGQALHLLYDAHGSTRALTDVNGAIQTGQTFSYDAYGNAVGFDTANALTALLYSGEFTNANTGGQYLRARYYDAASGRFNRLDPFAGSASNPLSFHKYGYTHGNPVSGVDPSGLFSLAERLTVSGISVVMFTVGFTGSSQHHRGQLVQAQGGNLAPNWANGFGNVHYGSHETIIPIPSGTNAGPLMDAIYSDLSIFAHFNTRNSVASVRTSNASGRDLAFFKTLQPVLAPGASILNGSEVPVEFLKNNSTREVTAVTLGWHMLSGVRKWDVRQSGISGGWPLFWESATLC